MKVLFMGTPDFAAKVLDAVVKAGHEITAVYTQPDKAKGRSGALVASPVKEYALSKGFAVYQPERIKRAEYVEELKTIQADVYVVAAYGQILSQEILDIPKFGCINVHGSLLPKYRGAAPIQRSIANGEKVTGVTIMQMDKGMDTGDIISQVEFPIENTDTEDTVYEKMAEYGAKALTDVLADLNEGNIKRVPQDNSLATMAPPLSKEEGLLSFEKSAWELDCKIRGFQSWPTAYTYYKGKLLKVYAAKASDFNDGNEYEPGTFVVLKKNIYIACKDALLELLEVQIEGKKRMPAMDFARGTHVCTGEKTD